MNKYTATERIHSFISDISEKIRKMNGFSKRKSEIYLRRNGKNRSEAKEMIDCVYSFRNIDGQCYKI